MRWVVLLGAVWGCAGTDGARGPGPATFGDTTADTSSATSTMATDEGPLCVPGMQVACACPGGASGSQACNEDGSGYLPCECPMDTTTGGQTTAATAGSGSESGSETSPIPASCDPTWNCGDCSACDDCMACEGCVSCGAEFDCAEPYDACIADPACEDAVACSIECGSTGSCAMMCAPDGAAGKLYSALFQCMTPICLNHCGL